MSQAFLVDPDHPTPPGEALNVGDVWKVRVMSSAHVHSHVEINLLVSGSMTYLFNGRTVTLRKGDLGLFWAAIPHRVITVDEPTYFICVDLPVEMFLAMPGCEDLKTALLQGGMLVAGKLRSYDEEQFRSWHGDIAAKSDTLTSIVRDELAVRLRRIAFDGWRDLTSDEEEQRALADDPRSGDQQRDKVHRMARYIAEHATEAISVADIAASVALHPNYAMTLFRKTLGMTINEYITRQRLMLAHGRLLASDGDIAAIAFEAGFGSLSRFYEAFRARYGCTPRDMRRNFQQTREAATA
ncbi:helix-turn-helix domain-containing protein [Kaistia dalseonensis]|uniref:AraC-like DNA-binding protein/mannose-6-phosphate isomerase-like protein (Cupin superfamily) n=1 Tax=Kaistia dalseonensis TaxID=410840 RepID=A0ABU0HD10_9HYPH|nr:helix-turn-helix domain-containing protein [Kaistia dalseonensis]MCX5497566.1 helix-turn-helix domain-containing protein [Kaistia dalseonensis]MDQ0440206.1 AraC-like DNA-binding protein/mannose-6-phosphate isomerase-like protein (cupin superfamily) [Kaistia dalseonensis]